ncbi:hypothetical protein NQ315_013378 [Exocentrus adspersus]|uniref:Ras-related protein Rab-10 n=1 Tax=Exocentrus adspersus TaxID=1586481 RepID=A0AAV8VS06_9CUCU|nr:hypothetical protein NQ315_013378 [Exocentrus adspersus]
MAKKTYDLLFKLLLIGDSGVGKTCILFRFSDDAFTTTFISTIGTINQWNNINYYFIAGIDFKIKTVELRGKKNQTTDMGYCGAGEISHNNNFILQRSDGYNHANEDVEKMILGNKCDMTDKRIVSKERGETIAREHGIRFMETSAKANINIERAFNELAEAILDKTAGREPGDHIDRVMVDRRQQSTSKSCCT